MKRYIAIIILVLGFVIPGTAYAQSFNDIYKKYKRQDDIEGLKINKLGCLMLGLFGGSADDDEKGAELIKKSSAMHVLINEGEQKSELMKDLTKYIQKSKLEQLISLQEDGEVISIYIREKKKAIRELLIVVSGDDEQVVVHLDGKFPLEMIREMVQDGEGGEGINLKFIR